MRGKCAPLSDPALPYAPDLRGPALHADADGTSAISTMAEAQHLVPPPFIVWHFSCIVRLSSRYTGSSCCAMSSSALVDGRLSAT